MLFVGMPSEEMLPTFAFKRSTIKEALTLTKFLVMTLIKKNYKIIIAELQ